LPTANIQSFHFYIHNFKPNIAYGLWFGVIFVPKVSIVVL